MSAMDAANLSFGENGRLQHISSKCDMVDVLFQLIRGCSEHKILGFEAKLKANLQVIRQDKNLDCEERDARLQQVVTDAFLIWAHTRDVRDGKGEKKASMLWFARIAKLFPETAMEMVPLVPQYGYWKDVLLYSTLEEMPKPIGEALLKLMANQISVDHEALLQCENPSLTPVSKWAPSEKGAYGDCAKRLAQFLFPEDEQRRKRYRTMISALRIKSDVVEVKMCKGEWSLIDPGKVPAACLRIHSKAFMNKPVKKSKDPCENTVRSENPDRVKCATNFTEHAQECIKNPGGKKSMHGKNQHPHEMVAKYLTKREEKDDILEAQWVDLRERTRAKVSAESPDAKQKGAMQNLVPLVDVSGSMAGTPMEVAVALGILISEVTAREFRNRFLTFTTEPEWHSMDPSWSLHQKVMETKKAKWGMKTNLSKALEKILDVCTEAKVSAKDVSELVLVVLSDMQFDASLPSQSSSHSHFPAHVWKNGIMVPVQEEVQDMRPWETQYQEMTRRFSESGYPDVPRVVFWNLRGDTHGSHAPVTADTPGVDMVSGFSPNLLELFMSGGNIAGYEEKKKTPEETARESLDKEVYDPVREACLRVSEWRHETSKC